MRTGRVGERGEGIDSGRLVGRSSVSGRGGRGGGARVRCFSASQGAGRSRKMASAWTAWVAPSRTEKPSAQTSR